MNAKEFVEKYVSECYAKIIKFIIVQLILDAVEIVVFVLALITAINKQNNLYVTIVSFVIVLMVTIFVNICVSFGSFKAFVQNISIYRNYSNAAAEYLKTNDTELFNKKLAEMEEKIKSLRKD